LIQGLSKDVVGDKASPKQGPAPTPTTTTGTTTAAPAPAAAAAVQKSADDRPVPDEKQTRAKAVHG